MIDDASTDDTAEVARQSGARVIRLPRQSGPAVARNRGAAEARGEHLVFIDADVCVHGESLAQLIEPLELDPTIDAVIGSYDAQPREPGLISQYRNLLHHFTHQQAREEASTFWSGCGAVRKTVFLRHGGFDASYTRPSIEDVELGRRLRRAGSRIVFRKDAQATHLKRWTLWSMVRTDVLKRALPWTQLLLRERSLPNDLNLQTSQRLSTILTGAMIGLWIVAAVLSPPLFLLPILTLAIVLLADRVASVVAFGVAVMIPGLLAATWAGGVWMVAALVCLLGAAALNYCFYRFLFRERGLGFVVLTVPLHLLYFTYCGATLTVAVTMHVTRRISSVAFRSALARPILEES